MEGSVRSMKYLAGIPHNAVQSLSFTVKFTIFTGIRRFKKVIRSMRTVHKVKIRKTKIIFPLL
jgi:hypothetical protein